MPIVYPPPKTVLQARCDCTCHCPEIAGCHTSKPDWDYHWEFCLTDSRRAPATHSLIFVCPQCGETWTEAMCAECVTDCWNFSTDVLWDCSECQCDTVPNPTAKRIIE
jgi:hypothetical protein